MDPWRIDDFAHSLAWLFDNPDAQRLEESILGVIRALDQPRSPAGAAIGAFFDSLDSRDLVYKQSYRDQVLATSHADLCRVAEQYLNSNKGVKGALTFADHSDEAAAIGLSCVKI